MHLALHWPPPKCKTCILTDTLFADLVQMLIIIRAWCIDPVSQHISTGVTVTTVVLVCVVSSECAVCSCLYSVSKDTVERCTQPLPPPLLIGEPVFIPSRRSQLPQWYFGFVSDLKNFFGVKCCFCCSVNQLWSLPAFLSLHISALVDTRTGWVQTMSAPNIYTSANINTSAEARTRVSTSILEYDLIQKRRRPSGEEKVVGWGLKIFKKIQNFQKISKISKKFKIFKKGCGMGVDRHRARLYPRRHCGRVGPCSNNPLHQPSCSLISGALNTYIRQRVIWINCRICITCWPCWWRWCLEQKAATWQVARGATQGWGTPSDGVGWRWLTSLTL